MNEVTSLLDLLIPGESALAIFTNGNQLILNDDGTGTSGNWVLDSNREADRLVLYLRSGGTAEPAQIYVADYVDAAPSTESGRFVVNFRSAKLVGTTRSSWPKFAWTGANPVRFLTKPTNGESEPGNRRASGDMA